jgi:hypothetical protein
MVAFSGLMLIEQPRDRGHIEEPGSRRIPVASVIRTSQ